MNTPVADTPLLSVRQIVAMLVARRALIATVLVLTVLAVAAILYITPRTWVASADVYSERAGTITAAQSFSSIVDNGYLDTQVDMIKSQAVADVVFDMLGLEQSALYQETAAQRGATDARQTMVRHIIEHTSVTTNNASRMLEVSYAASTPERARDIANALVAAYISVSERIFSTSARSRHEQYVAQLDQLRNEADSIRAELTQHQQKTGILDTSGRDELALRQLNELAVQLAIQKARYEGSEAAISSYRQMMDKGVRPEDISAISEQPAINDLKAKYSDAVTRATQTLSVYGPQHPAAKAAIADRNELQARIRREAQAAVLSAEAEARQQQAQVRAMEADIARLRAAVLENQGHRDTLLAYQRRLDSVEQVYRSALQNYDKLLMDSQVVLPTLAVMRPASVPTEPASPRVAISLAASVVVGLLGGMMLALLLELSQRRIRSIDDIRRGVPAPILGRIGNAPGRTIQ